MADDVCTLCPRNCNVNRTDGGSGYCGMDSGLNIASVCVHRGEEPVIGGDDGICNIFFAGCNLRCVYCQNHEISQPCSAVFSLNDIDDVLAKVCSILDTGINSVGFVSPSHMIPQMKMIISGLHEKGYIPVIVYNTNSYDRVETIKSLDGIVDVYLPDFKYADADLSFRLSGASDYPEVAMKALKEMYYQMGSTLHTDINGKAVRGLLIRHLVLPGLAEESKKVLSAIASELSTGVNISLMSQYHPMHEAKMFPSLDRSLNKQEYDDVLNHMQELGFRNGWVQDPDSFRNYLPDFTKEHPFES
ncbi:MAG TPA: radical SAM protein [Bacteroidales bacterium]|nr:radical SAM protein [Bacteroidales bacterium]